MFKKKKVSHFEKDIFKGDDLAKAKTIFFRYKGNTFGMMNDGIYEEYKACKIPKETEKLWLKEINES